MWLDSGHCKCFLSTEKQMHALVLWSSGCRVFNILGSQTLPLSPLSLFSLLPAQAPPPTVPCSNSQPALARVSTAIRSHRGAASSPSGPPPAPPPWYPHPGLCHFFLVSHTKIPLAHTGRTSLSFLIYVSYPIPILPHLASDNVRHSFDIILSGQTNSFFP